MKPTLILLTALLLASMNCFPQQNSPVAGQASTLVDLLKKDYSAIDPDLRGDEILKDRAQVISIFRSFLKAEYATPFARQNALNTELGLAATAYTTYSQAKKLVTSPQINGISTTNKEVVAEINTTQNDNNVNYDNMRKAYYRAQFRADKDQLALLFTHFDEDKNSFVTDIITLFQTKYRALEVNDADLMATVNTNSSVQKALPFLGGSLDVSSTQIIDGIGKFLAKRIKEELMTFAVQNIQLWINDHQKKTPVEELLVLLPTTSQYLMRFDPDKLTSFPAELKQYIQNDLNHLVDNAYNLKTTTLFQRLILNHPELELAFDAIPLIGELSKVRYPGDYFNILGSSQLVTDLRDRADIPSKNIAAFISTMEMLSNSLTVIQNGEPGYTTVDFWKTYGLEVNFMKLYIGFLYQQDVKYYQVVFKRNGQPDADIAGLLKTLMADAVNRERVLKTLVPVYTNICKTSEKIYNQAQLIKKLNNAGQPIGADTLYTFTKSIIDFSSDLGNDADQLISLFSRHNIPNLQIHQYMQPFLQVAGTANDAIRNIRNKQYAQGITQLLGIAAQFDPSGKVNNLPEFASLFNIVAFQPAIWTDWKTVNGLQANPNGVPQNVADAANRVAVELAAIRNFYISQVPAPDAAFTNVTGNLNVALANLRAGGNLPAGSVADLTNLLTNDTYGKIIVSYYAGFMMERMAADLQTKMEAMQVNGAPAFHHAQAVQFVGNLKDYLVMVFNNHITGTANDPVALTAKQRALDVDISSYLTDLPLVFGWQLDSKTLSIIHFVNDMAAAKNSDDVEKAVEALALPAGSYSVKQKSVYTITINSFPGFLGGWDFAGGNVPGTATVGFTAPVGLNVTWGKFCHNWTFGLYAPLIDVGAVTRLRLGNNDNTDALPQITWKNIFSPGLFACFGLDKTPLSINLGAQYGPEVRDIKQGVTKSSFRAGIGITLDIPLFNIYNKPSAQ